MYIGFILQPSRKYIAISGLVSLPIILLATSNQGALPPPVTVEPPVVFPVLAGAAWEPNVIALPSLSVNVLTETVSTLSPDFPDDVIVPRDAL